MSETTASPPTGRDPDAARQAVTRALAVGLCVFTLVQVNYPILAPQPQLAVFALLGLVICFLNVPVHPSLKDNPAARAGDLVLAGLAVGLLRVDPRAERAVLRGPVAGRLEPRQPRGVRDRGRHR